MCAWVHVCVHECACVCDSRSVLLLTNPSSLWEEFSNDLDCLSNQNNFVADMKSKMSTYQLTCLLSSCSPLHSAAAGEKYNHPLLKRDKTPSDTQN